MPIVSSQIVSSSVQVDGRLLVKERHVDHNGKTHEHEYLAAIGLDVDAVLTARAANIGAAIDMRDAVEAEANNFEIPLTRIAYVRRFTSVERKAIANAAKTNDSVGEFWNMLSWADGGIHIKSPEVQGALQMFETAGLIGVGRAAVIGAA